MRQPLVCCIVRINRSFNLDTLIFPEPMLGKDAVQYISLQELEMARFPTDSLRGLPARVVVCGRGAPDISFKAAAL